MDKLLYALLPALGCAVMMGAMMWVMMRGNHGNTANAAQSPQQSGETQDEIARLRAEVALLREEQRNRQQQDSTRATGGNPVTGKL